MVSAAASAADDARSAVTRGASATNGRGDTPFAVSTSPCAETSAQSATPPRKCRPITRDTSSSFVRIWRRRRDLPMDAGKWNILWREARPRRRVRYGPGSAARVPSTSTVHTYTASARLDSGTGQTAPREHHTRQILLSLLHCSVLE
jgi:hypothetical protein